jgi:translation initiation factor 2B subunit (eIF-2B alpha/beta/delta family)
LLVGADTVYEDGSIQNKIGTLPLVEAARRLGIRRLVSCELLKRTDSFSKRGRSAHRDPSEPVMITSRDRSQAGIAKSPDQAPEGREWGA